MDDLVRHLEAMRAALEESSYQAPEEFSAVAVDVGRKTVLAMVNEMISQHRNGISELEIISAFPFSLAFLVNAISYCTEGVGNTAVAERMLDTTKTIVQQLGDGDPTRLSSSHSPQSCN